MNLNLKKALKPKQARCIALMVAGDQTQREIAEQLHVTSATICNWKKSADFMAEYNAAVRDRLTEVAAAALATEIELLGAKSEMVRLMAARDLLNRAGIEPQDAGPSVAVPVVIAGGELLED